MDISNERLNTLEVFQKKYKLKFKNINLLNQAFIHTSYTNENNIDVSESYEKLEFFGDSVLKIVISDYLYNNYPEYNEGKLTQLRAQIVSDKFIFNLAKKLGFEELIILSKNEKKLGGAKKESILACAFEALLGAIFIEYDKKAYQKCYDFLINNFENEIKNIENSSIKFNPKSYLQEYTQNDNHTLPEYKLIKEEGKAHKKTFFVQVEFKDKVIGKGQGTSIKEAQQNAAYNALQILGIAK